MSEIALREPHRGSGARGPWLRSPAEFSDPQIAWGARKPQVSSPAADRRQGPSADRFIDRSRRSSVPATAWLAILVERRPGSVGRSDEGAYAGSCETSFIGMRCSSSTRSTPMCAIPPANPPGEASSSWCESPRRCVGAGFLPGPLTAPGLRRRGPFSGEFWPKPSPYAGCPVDLTPYGL